MNERGPLHIFQHVRERVGIRHDEDGLISVIPQTFAGELLSCRWCVSIWVGAAWAICAIISPMTTLVALPFALSAAAIIVESFVRRG